MIVIFSSTILNDAKKLRLFHYGGSDRLLPYFVGLLFLRATDYTKSSSRKSFSSNIFSLLTQQLFIG